MGRVCRQTAGIRSERVHGGQPRQAEPRFEPIQPDCCADRENTQSNPVPPPAQRSGILSLLPDLKIDQDKIIIILLIAVLAKNGADIKLLLALGYLLMD